MQVFKAYFKVLNDYKEPMIMYIVIFAVLLYFFIIPALGKNNNEGYVEQDCKFAVFDYDESEASKAFVSYLSKRNTVVEIKADEKEVIQDELYYRNIVCALRIPEGFEEQMESGRVEDILEVVTIPGTQAASVFESQIDGYLSAVSTYADAGFSLTEAMEKAEKALDVNVDVSLPDDGDVSAHTSRYYYYNYLAWIMICIMILGVCPILLTFAKDEIKKRMECSAYHFSSFNKELLLGVLVTGIGICVLLVVLSVMCFGKDMMNISGLLNIVNLICYMLVALAIAFVISRLIHNIDLLNMAANIISLGMSFLCGIFVPREFLGEGVIKLAHFLPAYWYNQTVTALDRYTPEVLPDVVKYMGIEVLFAVVIVVVGLVIARKQQMK